MSLTFRPMNNKSTVVAKKLEILHFINELSLMVGFFLFNDIVGHNWIPFTYRARKRPFNEPTVRGDGDD